MVSEIRDKATRRRLAVLPYELRFKEPFPEYVRLGEYLCPMLMVKLGPRLLTEPALVLVGAWLLYQSWFRNPTVRIVVGEASWVMSQPGLAAY